MESNLSQIILSNVTQFIQSWKNLKPHQLELKRMSGLTNTIFKVSHQNQLIIPKSIIYRMLGDDSQNLFLDRKLENKLVEVLQFSCGPKIYGFNNQLRIQEYLNGNVLQTVHMQDNKILKGVAAKIQILQKQHLDFLQRKSVFQNICSNQKYLTFLQQKIKKVELFQPWQLQILHKLKEWIGTEIHFIRSKLPHLNKKLVLSHNDLLPGNVMILPDKLEFIDFQYTGYNYDTYDIANYLNESLIHYIEQYPCFQCKNLLPDQQIIETILQYYLLHKNLNQQQFINIDNQQTRKKLIESNNLQSEFERLIKEIRLTLMLSNFYWGTWCIFLTKNNSITFDYIKFGELRMQQYYANKNLLKL